MIDPIDDAVRQIQNLCAIPSPSGFTQAAENHVCAVLRDAGFEPWQTNKGSVLCNLGGEGDPLIVAAHIDTLGAVVRAVKPNGRLRISRVGGFPEVYVGGENCTVHTRGGASFSGTFQLNNPAVHVNKDVGSVKRDDANIEIVLDELVAGPDGVRSLGIAPGDFVSFDPRTVVTPSGFIKSRHLDDKASAGLLLALARECDRAGMRPSRRTYLLFTTYEEVGHGASAGLPPDAAEFLSVDMGAVGDDLGGDETKVSICAKDSNGPYDWGMTNRLVAVAKERGLDYAVDIFPDYGSDAGAALSAGHDLRHALIGPGVAASHGYERTHWRGLANTYGLLAGFLGL
jgi:putative aminopeptidase FrvX